MTIHIRGVFMKIGFIGLGIMGRPMAKNLLRAGYSVQVFDINAAAVEDLAAAGASAGSSPRQTAEAADIIILMLPNSPQVREVVLGADGVLEGCSGGEIIIDMSSISPIVSQEVAAAAADKGVEMLDAPVSGGEPKAVDGTLSIMVGGKETIFAQVREVLGVMGASVVLTGGIGSGNTTKLTNQIIVALNIAAVAEGMVLAKKAGVNPQTVFEAIRGGLAGSTVMNAKMPMILERNFQPGFRIELHVKDLTNALDTAKELDLKLPLTEATFGFLQWMVEQGMGTLDHSGLVKYFEHLNGVEVMA